MLAIWGFFAISSIYVLSPAFALTMGTLFRKSPTQLSYYFVGHENDQIMLLGDGGWLFWLMLAIDCAILTAGGWTLLFAVRVVTEGALTLEVAIALIK